MDGKSNLTGVGGLPTFFSEGSEEFVTVRETLGQVIPYRPETPVRLAVEWNTDVISSHNGTERRQSLREFPRQQLEYTYALSNEETRQLRSQLFSLTNSSFTVPLWFDSYPIDPVSSPIAALSGDFTNRILTAGQLVYIQPPNLERGEFGTIQTVTDALLTLSGAVTRPYPPGTRVYPCVSVRIPDDQSFARLPVNLTTTTLQLSVTDFFPIIGSTDDVTTYQGLPLLDRVPSNNSAVSEQANRSIRVIDFGGTQTFLTGRPRALLTRAHDWRIGDRIDLRYWLRFIDDVRGRWKAFYLSTYRDDLVIDTPPLAGGVTIEVIKSPSYLTRWFNNGTSHQDLQLETNLGNLQRRVTSVVDTGQGTEVLTIDSPLPALTVVSKVSFLEKCRFASDTFLIDSFPTYSRIQASVVVIEQAGGGS